MPEIFSDALGTDQKRVRVFLVETFDIKKNMPLYQSHVERDRHRLLFTRKFGNILHIIRNNSHAY